MFFNINICFVFSSQSLQQADTQYILLSVQKRKSLKIIPNIKNPAAIGYFLLGTQEQVQNSRGIQVTSVRAAEVLLYLISTNLFVTLHLIACKILYYSQHIS